MKFDKIAIFFGYLLLAIFFRSVSFFMSVIDTDESLYLLMTNSFLEGDVLYKNIWDHKPPGIYLIFAAVKLILQDSIFSIRIIACVAVASSAYLLFLFSRNILKGTRGLNLVPGILYLVFTLNNGGLASNTEIFFTPFVVASFYILLKDLSKAPIKISNKTLLSVGCLLGIGLQIKYIVLFDFIAVLLIILVYHFYFLGRGRERLANIANNFLILCFLFFLPFLLVAIYFVVIDHLALYVDSNFKPNIVNSTNSVFSISVFLRAIHTFLRDNFLIALGGVLGIGLLFKNLYRKRNLREEKVLVFLLIWLFMTILGVCYTKRFYSHYFLQTLPSLCLISGLILSRIFNSKILRWREYYSLALILLPSIFYVVNPNWTFQIKILKNRYVEGREKWGDTPGKIAIFLERYITHKDYIYVANYEPIIYDLTGAKIPTKFVFPLFIISEHFSTVAGVNGVEELDQILGKKPKYIVFNPVEESSEFYDHLRKVLDSKYDLIKSIDGIDIYEIVTVTGSESL